MSHSSSQSLSSSLMLTPCLSGSGTVRIKQRYHHTQRFLSSLTSELKHLRHHCLLLARSHQPRNHSLLLPLSLIAFSATLNGILYTSVLNSKSCLIVIRCQLYGNSISVLTSSMVDTL